MIGQLWQLFLLLRVWFFSEHHGRLGKIKWILCADCQPGWARWVFLAKSSGFTPFSAKKKKEGNVAFWPNNKSFTIQYNKFYYWWPSKLREEYNNIIYTEITILKTNCNNYWTKRLYNVISICLKNQQTC